MPKVWRRKAVLSMNGLASLDVQLKMFKFIMQGIFILIYGLGKERFAEQLEKDYADFLRIYD